MPRPYASETVSESSISPFRTYCGHRSHYILTPSMKRTSRASTAAEGGTGGAPFARGGPSRARHQAVVAQNEGAAATGSRQPPSAALGGNNEGDPPLPPSLAAAELDAAQSSLATSKASLALLRVQIEEEDAVAVREARSGRSEGDIDPRFGAECAALIRMTSKPFADLPRVLQRRVVEAALRIRLREAEADVARDAERVEEAEAGVVAEASEHNAEQPFVLLPDVLQKMIIDLLPVGR